MDRVYLFFRRWNTSKDDMLKFSEFQMAISPVDQREAYTL